MRGTWYLPGSGLGLVQLGLSVLFEWGIRNDGDDRW